MKPQISRIKTLTEEKQPVTLRVNGKDIPFDQVQKLNPSVLFGGLPEHLQEVIAASAAPGEIIESFPIPDWARRAAKLAFAEFMPDEKSSGAFQMGWFYGMAIEFLPVIERLAAKSPALENISAFTSSLVAAMPTLAAQESLENAGEFYDGAREAKRSAIAMNELPHNPKCLAVISVGWRLFDGMSMGRVHRVFIEWKLITPNTDSRVTRLLLSSIRFPVGKAGRPKAK